MAAESRGPGDGDDKGDGGSTRSGGGFAHIFARAEELRRTKAATTSSSGDGGKEQAPGDAEDPLPGAGSAVASAAVERPKTLQVAIKGINYVVDTLTAATKAQGEKGT